MSNKIRVAIVYPSGRAKLHKIKDGERFTINGERYDPPTRNDFVKFRALGFDFEGAIYQSGVPKARPSWIHPSPGLTGKDLQNVDGDWLLNLVRRALADAGKLQGKDLIMLAACVIGALASIASLIINIRG